MRVVTGARVDLHGAFADDVRAGLCRTPKSISCRYLYDAEGSRLFEAICALPEYYPTRTEAAILRTMAPAFAARFEDPPELIELGSGSSVKTRLLIEALLARHGHLLYRPIDISEDALVPSARELLRDFDGLKIHAIASEYVAGIRELESGLASGGPSETPRLVLWLGSSIGNFGRTEAAAFLRSMGRSLRPRDRFLIGIDLRKERTVLEAAYDDAAGVTASFNKNLLVRINRELGGDFDVDRFRHVATYDKAEGAIKMLLVSEDDARVHVGELDLDVRFAAGEAMHTESSYKYSQSEIEALAGAPRFRLEEQWRDDDGRFSLNLMAPESIR